MGPELVREYLQGIVKIKHLLSAKQEARVSEPESGSTKGPDRKATADTKRGVTKRRTQEGRH